MGDVFYSSPVIDENGRIYLVAYTGSGKNKLYCLNEDGNLVSSSDDSSYSINGLVDTPLTLDAFGNLYFGSLDGKLYSIRNQTGLNLEEFKTNPVLGQASKLRRKLHQKLLVW